MWLIRISASRCIALVFLILESTVLVEILILLNSWWPREHVQNANKCMGQLPVWLLHGNNKISCLQSDMYEITLIYSYLFLA